MQHCVVSGDTYPLFNSAIQHDDYVKWYYKLYCLVSELKLVIIIILLESIVAELQKVSFLNHC